MGDRDAFARAHSVGSLLQAIREAISPDPVERKSLASDLAVLHNDGTIDLVATFSGLSGAAESGPEFFLQRHVFEEVLPHLEAPVAQVAQCVQRLYREAGTDMAAGTVLDAFRDFCAKRPERVPAALSAIEAAPEVLSDLVVAVLVAGSTMDPAAYAAEAIRLAGHANLELRRRALFAIGRLDLAKATGGREQALAVIDKAVEGHAQQHRLRCGPSLFLRPISAASFVVSLLGRAPADPPLQGGLEALLLNPLLINFSGNVAEYLGSRAAIEEEPVKAAIQRSLDGLERYLAGLRSVGEIAALHPSLEHRDAYRRHFAGEMARSFKKAQAESVLMQLVHKSVLLYGRKAIHHVIGPEGEINRMETHLGSHGTQIEVPRLTILDPHGLDYMLRVFRHERLES